MADWDMCSEVVDGRCGTRRGGTWVDPSSLVDM